MILLLLLLHPVTGGLHPKNSRSFMASNDMPGPYYDPSPTFLLFGSRGIGLPKKQLTREFESQNSNTNSMSSQWANPVKSTSGHFVNKDKIYTNQNQIKTVSEPEVYLPKKTETKAEEITNQKTESYIMPPRSLKPRLYHVGRRQFFKSEHIWFPREHVSNSTLPTIINKNDKVREKRPRRRRETTRKYKKYGKIKVSENSKNKWGTENIDIKSYESRNKNNNVQTSPEIAEFERFVMRVMSCRQIPALSVAIVQKGVPLLVRSFGVADFENSKNASTKTKFFIASLTKSFTSTIIARVLTERRDLTWNTAIHHFIPGFQLPDRTRTEQSTLRDLLGHRTGICGLFRPLLYGFPQGMSRKEFVNHIRFQPICSGFRDRFLYNNYMYVLAAHVTEQLTNQTWEELVMCHLLRPIGMKDTGFADHVESFEDFAFPYVRKDGKFKKLGMEVVKSVSPAGPAGSMYSTPGDMLKWMQLHLNLHTSFNSASHLDSKKNVNVTSKSRNMNSDNKSNIHIVHSPRSNLIGDLHGKLNLSIKSESKLKSQTNLNLISDSNSDLKCNSKLQSDTILNAAQLGIDPQILMKTHEAVSPKPQLEPDLTRPQFPIDDVFVSYNMGWITSMYRGFKRLWHSGSIPPYGSLLHLFPEVDSGIFISVSGPLGMDANYALSTIAWRGGDLLLGVKPWLNATTACSYPQPWRQVSETDNLNGDQNVNSNLSSISNQNASILFNSDSQEDLNATLESIIQDSSLSPTQDVTVKQLLDLTGDYIHLAFGLIQVRYNSTSKRLHLHLGRYGHLQLFPTSATHNQSGKDYEAYNNSNIFDNGIIRKFEGINIGPFWFLSSSDDGHERLSVKFCKHAGITKLWFPVGAGNPVAFIRKFHKHSSSLAESATWDIKYVFKYLILYLLLFLFR